MDGARDLDVPLDRPVDIDGVAVHYFRVPVLRRLFWAPALERRLRESVADFDVVHTHGVFLRPMWAAAREARRAGVPYVVSPHGMLIRELIRRKSRWTKTAWIQLIERRTLAGAAGLHVTASIEEEEIRALQLPLPPLVTQIPNGVDWPATHVPLAQTPFAGLPPHFALFLSRINWKKGLDRLVTAWQWVPDLPLVIAGNDEEGYRPKLENLAQKLGVAHRVLFIGTVSDEHKWALYEQAEMFLLPSYSENFGIVVAEAMAMGCPVVVTPDVGMAQFVRSAGAGVVTSNDPRTLASVVRELSSDESRRRELGHCGRDAVARNLSWSAVVTQMEDFYTSVVVSARASGEVAARI
jgi:glycosyltransferase involved in cell wall biosynthesis